MSRLDAALIPRSLMVLRLRREKLNLCLVQQPSSRLGNVLGGRNQLGRPLPGTATSLPLADRSWNHTPVHGHNRPTPGVWKEMGHAQRESSPSSPPRSSWSPSSLGDRLGPCFKLDVTPGAVSSRVYGIPTPWRIEVQRGCPPWYDLPRNESYYNPPFFVVDTLFYLALGYVLLPSYERWRKLKANRISLESSLSPILSNLTASLGIPGVKRVSLVMVLVLVVSVPIAETALLWAVVTPPLPSCVPGCIPAGLLVLDSYFASSPTNLTLNIRNVGSGTTRLQSYSVSDTVNQFSNPNWSGPTIGRGSITPVRIIIDGQAFTFHWGGFYKIEVSTSNQDGSCCEGIFTFQTEQLGMNIKFSSLNTTRGMILNITNTGPPTITLTAYYVIDSQGHWYNNTAWSGPTIRPGSIVTTDIIIDGNAFTFQPGSSYTIQVVDSTNTEYTI